MDTENTPETGLSSMDQAVEAIRNSRRKPEAEQPEPETATEEPENETEGLTDEVSREEVEQDDDPDAEGENPDEDVDGDTDEEADDEEEALYEVEGETFTLSELQEWKKSGLRQNDYTRKTQELSAEREKLIAERDAFVSEREQVAQNFQQQQAQLQEALAVFSIEQLKPPKRSDFPNVDAFLQAQEQYATAEKRKSDARAMYQNMQAEQQQVIRQREAERAMQFFPEWSTDEGFSHGVQRMTQVAKDFGFTQDEIVMGGLTDHRTFRVLAKLADLQEQVGEREARKKAAAKKVVAARKRLPPGTPNDETEATKEQRKARERLKKTRSTQDAVALLRARRKG